MTNEQKSDRPFETISSDRCGCGGTLGWSLDESGSDFEPTLPNGEDGVVCYDCGSTSTRKITLR